MNKEKPSIELTVDEALCTLSAVVQAIGNFNMGAESLDRDDRESLMQLRSAAMKLAQICGMSIDELYQFAAYAAGRPATGVVAVIQEELKRAGKL